MEAFEFFSLKLEIWLDLISIVALGPFHRPLGNYFLSELVAPETVRTKRKF